MTQTGYSNALVNAMLGWLKALAGWVLKLFNLAGGASPLLWLSEHWLQLLLLLLIVGVVTDWLVWMVRWRPYWVWLRKKRIIVNDERFLRDEPGRSAPEDGDTFEQEYIVPSTIVRRKESPARKPSQTSTRRPKPAHPRPSSVRPRREPADVPADELFEIAHDHEDYSDYSEDAVFNVSSLPEAQARNRHGHKRR